jgi:hypothetical protein
MCLCTTKRVARCKRYVQAQGLSRRTLGRWRQGGHKYDQIFHAKLLVALRPLGVIPYACCWIRSLQVKIRITCCLQLALLATLRRFDALRYVTLYKQHFAFATRTLCRFRSRLLLLFGPCPICGWLRKTACSSVLFTCRFPPCCWAWDSVLFPNSERWF